jgi:adenylosuccinate lyase
VPVCAIEFRYGRNEMKEIFSEEAKLQAMLDVEAGLARALAKVGRVPPSAAKVISSKAKTSVVRVERVNAIEREINHDIMSVVKALAEKCGDAGGYVHLGATSNDIIDTATALQLKAAMAIILKDCRQLRDSMLLLAAKHKRTPMVGRTHGQFAVPVTFGLKMAVFAMEMQRHIERLQQAQPRVCVGKLAGAVGTGAALGKDALRVQDLLMSELGLGTEEAATQLVGRDRYAELVMICANIAASIERYGTEIRNLQRSEIGEVAEAFNAKKQVGSSTMAHKRNPITSENVCGLSRIIRGFVTPTLENIASWHERDLTNSSAERFILPHVCVLTDDIVAKMDKVVKGLEVFPIRMRGNIESAGGLIMAESVMIALTGKGMSRQDAHEATRRAAMLSVDKDVAYKDALLRNPKIKKLLTPKELVKVLDPLSYIGSAEEIVNRALKYKGK